MLMKSNRSSISSTYGGSLPRVHKTPGGQIRGAKSSLPPSTAAPRLSAASGEFAAPHINEDDASQKPMADRTTPDRRTLQKNHENSGDGSLPRIQRNSAPQGDSTPSSEVVPADLEMSPTNQPPSSARNRETPAPDASTSGGKNGGLPPITTTGGENTSTNNTSSETAVVDKLDDKRTTTSVDVDVEELVYGEFGKGEGGATTIELKSSPPAGSRPQSTRPIPAALNISDLDRPRISPREQHHVVVGASSAGGVVVGGASPGSYFGGSGRQDFSEVGSESSPPLDRNRRWAQPAVGRGRGGRRGGAMAASLYGAKTSTYHTRQPPPLLAPRRGGGTMPRSSSNQQPCIGSAPAGGGGGRGGVGRVGGGARTSHPTTSRYALRLGGGSTNTKPQSQNHQLITPRGQQHTSKNSYSLTPPSAARLQQSYSSSPGGQHLQQHSTPSPARKPYEIRTTQRVDPGFQTHPLGIELKERYQTHERMMLKLRAERTQLLRMRRTLAEETKKVGTLQHAFEQLKVKKQQVLESQQKLKNVDSVQNLKAQLAVKSDELSAINAEYKRVSAPLRARDRGSGGTSTGGAKGKLLQALEQKRLADELQKVAKYKSTKDGLEVEIGKMEALIHDYNARGLEALRDYVVPTKKENSDGPTTPPRPKDDIPLVPSKMPKVVKKLQEVAEVKQKLANETASHVALIAKKLDAARRVADATEEALKSAHYIQSEQEKERSQLLNEQKSLRVAIEGHKSNVTLLTEDTLLIDSAITRLTQTIKDASADLVVHQQRKDAKLRQDKAKEESAKQAADKAVKETAALRSEVELHKKELQEMNEKFNKLQKQLKEVKDKNKQRVERDNLAEVKLQIETSEIESQIKSEATKLADDERKHQQKLEDAAFSSQKKSILSELQSSLKTWTRKTVEMDANNNEVDERLDRILGILRANNIEVPF